MIPAIRRDFYSGRSPARGRTAMAATAHPDASALAIDILREGGNAVDAGIAAMALLCVIEPQATGIGGDCFAIYAPNGGPAIGLNGSGRAPRGASIAELLAKGMSEIPIESPFAVTVPGAVDAWCRLHADHGRLPFECLMAPAIRAAEDGFIVMDRVARDWAKLAGRLAADEVSRETMLVDGKAPQVGTLRKAPALGRTLREIAAKGRAGFYDGWVAKDIVARLNELGASHTVDDLAATACDYVELISTDYRGWQVCEIPPAGQGVTALMILNVLAAYDLPTLPEWQRVHILAEATKAAFRRRDALIGETPSMACLAERLLSDAETRRLRSEVRLDGVTIPPADPDFEHRDTTYLCVVDGDGNALSLINSLFEAFGTGISTRESGILLQNRGSSFRLNPDHPNALAPGKRPMHTIIPGMLLRNGRPAMPFGVMGGHYQPVGHAMLVSNIVDMGMNPQDALGMPRSFAHLGKLELEPGFDSEVVSRLRDLGHVVVDASTPMGGGQAIWIDQDTGYLCGGTDPRKDGNALAL